MATDVVSQEPLTILPLESRPNIDHLVTEDGAPVDGLFSEKQMRLLVESLSASWPGPGPLFEGRGHPFVAMANVGLFYALHQPAIVPDVLLSIDVSPPPDLHVKEGNSYFIWEFGRRPDVVIEIVSNLKGGEDSTKLAKYAEIGIPHYVIYDPARYLSDEVLRAYQLVVYSYDRMNEPIWFPTVGLGLQLWNGNYENSEDTWLRWVDAQGVLVPTGNEQRQRADVEQKRADRLAEQLRRLGVEPNGK